MERVRQDDEPPRANDPRLDFSERPVERDQCDDGPPSRPTDDMSTSDESMDDLDSSCNSASDNSQPGFIPSDSTNVSFDSDGKSFS